MKTKYDVGERVLVPGIVKKIEISNNGTAYQIAPEGFCCTELGFREDEIYGSLCEEEGEK